MVWWCFEEFTKLGELLGSPTAIHSRLSHHHCWKGLTLKLCALQRSSEPLTQQSMELVSQWVSALISLSSKYCLFCIQKVDFRRLFLFPDQIWNLSLFFFGWKSVLWLQTLLFVLIHLLNLHCKSVEKIS